MVEGQMERSQNWCDLGARQETGGEPKELKKEDEKEQEKEEDPYTFVEIEDSDYDMILANMSTKKKVGSRSFIINRPPAPTPRPTNIPPKEETTPYIAQGNALCCLCVRECFGGEGDCLLFSGVKNPKDENFFSCHR